MSNFETDTSASKQFWQPAHGISCGSPDQGCTCLQPVGDDRPHLSICPCPACSTERRAEAAVKSRRKDETNLDVLLRIGSVEALRATLRGCLQSTDSMREAIEWLLADA